MEYAIEIKDPSLRFNAMHFVGFKKSNGEWLAEPLHGHDFRVEVKIEEPLGEEGCVENFIAARNSLEDVLEGWDGRVLLPNAAPFVSYADYYEELEIGIALSDGNIQRWRVPQSAVRILRAVNASTELIAAAILDEWLELFSPEQNIAVELRLEEAPGCYAVAKRVLCAQRAWENSAPTP